MASEICLRLKLSNEERERVEWLVEKHQYLADARQCARQAEDDADPPGHSGTAPLHRADALASGHSLDHVAYCRQMLREWTPADLNPPPLVTGDDLKQPGWSRGRCSSGCSTRCARQLDGTIRTKDQGLALVDRLVAEWGG